MQIGSKQRVPVGWPGGPVHKPPKNDEGNFWKERAEEFREMLLFLDEEKLEDAGRIIKSLGSGLKGAWKQIKDIPAKIFNLDVVSDTVGEEKKESLLRWSRLLGQTAGFVASGGHALGGVLKIASGIQQKDRSRKLDGIMDVATASTLAAAVAGLPGVRAVLAPLAASFNVFRGSYNAGHGFKTRDGRKQVQGALDAVRSAGSVGRLLKHVAPVFRVAGTVLAPIAGSLQAGRGIYDVNIGLKNDDNKKMLKGLVDIATAVGTATAFASGAAVIPGIALAVVANIAKIAYEISPKARAKMDPWLDRAEPKLQKFVDKADQYSKPIRETWDKLWSRFVKSPEAPNPDLFTSEQIAEIAHVLASDGEYTRREERRFKTRLEQLGQRDLLPSRKDELPPLNREALLSQLKTHEQKVKFVRFLVTASGFDNNIAPAERESVDGLANLLGVDTDEMWADWERARKESLFKSARNEEK